MAEKQTREDRIPEPITPRDLRFFAAKLRKLADDYDLAVSELAKVNGQTIEIAGKKSANRGLGYLEGWERTISKATENAMIEQGLNDAESLGKSHAQDMAAEESHGATRKKKGKK